MTIRFLTILFAALMSSGVYANCGVTPTPPAFLEQAQIQAEAVESSKAELDTYFEIVENYLACVDEQIAQIAPADAPMEVYDSPEYQSQFDAFKELTEMAESTRDIAVERYNYLLTITN